MTSHSALPRRGEIWTAMLGNPPVRHWVLVMSLDSRNLSDRVDSILIAPFGSTGADGPTTLKFDPGETGLPGPSWLKGHFITTLRPLSALRMRQAILAVQRAIDPESPPRKG